MLAETMRKSLIKLGFPVSEIAVDDNQLDNMSYKYRGFLRIRLTIMSFA